MLPKILIPSGKLQFQHANKSVILLEDLVGFVLFQENTCQCLCKQPSSCQLAPPL